MNDKNNIIVGMFGQSGSGKTSIITNLRPDIFDRKLVIMPNMIRKTFESDDLNIPIIAPNKAKDEINRYKNHIDFDFIEMSMIKSYIASQITLILRYFSNVKNAINEYDNTILVSDRSPLDFYAYTCCAINWISDGKYTINEFNGMGLVQIIETTIEELYDLVIYVKPHNGEVDSVDMDARNIGLYKEFTGKNWYDKSLDVNYNYPINALVMETSIESRVLEVENIICTFVREIENAKTTS